MVRSIYRAGLVALALGGALFAPSAPAVADTIMQQCGQQYQAAKAGNTLNGMTWNQFRTDCSARLKATPAAQTGAEPAVTPAAAPAPAPANPLKPAVAAAPAPAPVATPAPAAPAVTAAAPAMTKNGKPVSAGEAAHLARQRQCGTEWKANKVTLVAQTPGLTWPKYYSQCNTRLKAAGQ